jgi:hypothetical protein
MNDNEIMKLRSTKFSLSSWVRSFLFFIIDRAWVVWEVFFPPPELSLPLEWTGWGGGYGYEKGGGYEYGEGAWPPDEPPARGGGYEYGGEALPPVEAPTEGGGYVYGGYPYGESGGMDMVKEHYHPMNHPLEVEGIDREDSDMEEDMTVKVEVVEREHEGMVLARHWIDDGAERHR